MGYSDFSFKTPLSSAYDGITPGTVIASKAVITDASNKVNTLDITTPKIGGTTVTSSAAELNLIDNSVAGTAVASKALVLGTNKNVDVLAIADLKLGAGAGTSVTASAVELNKAGTKASSTCRLYNLGSPALADDDLIVVSTNMKVGSYTIASQPDIPRNITVTATAGATTDTLGTVTITGTNYDDEEISEVITPVAGSAVAGTKAFKTVTTVVGAGWVIDAVEGTNDTIKVGIGNELGLPLTLDSATEIMMGILGTTITATNPTVSNPASLEGTTIDMSSGTYNGTKEALVFIVD